MSQSKNSCGIEPLTTLVKSDVALDLLRKNHKEKHIFFNKALHNHFPHALLTYYALGADDEKLKKEYEEESEYLDDIPPLQNVKIDDSNWKNFIGQAKMYPNYLQFFTESIDKEGSLSTVLKYAFDKDAIPSLVAGAVHPLIHIGFGIEFEQPIIVAEGLAEMAVHNPSPKPLFDFEHGDHKVGKSALEIVNAMHEDKELEGLVDYSDKNKTDSTIKNAAEIIKNYAKDWIIVETEEGIREKLEELFRLSGHLYATSCFDPKHLHNGEVRLDFFLMHVFTSNMAVRQIIPHLNLSQARLLLKVHFPIALLYYIARGRPSLHPELLREYRSNISNINNWEEIIDLTINKQSDLHTSKVVRACKIADGMYNKEGNNSLFFDAAALTVDHWANKGKDWDMSGIGFEESWYN